MKQTYSVKIRADGVNRVGMNPFPMEVTQQRLEERREIRSGPLDTPCWIWTGGRSNRQGYGGMRVGGKVKMVHRVAWEVYVGRIPDGMDICHRCDVVRCFNPSHLFAGTHADNMKDAAKKNRFPIKRGEEGNCAILTEKEVLEIRQKALAGHKQRDIAAYYGVHRSAIYLIVKRKNWTHI